MAKVDPNAKLPAMQSYINMQSWKLIALVKSLMALNVGYKLGAKVVPLSKQAGQFNAVDCSGFVRWAIYHATLPDPFTFPDGSWNQHQAVKNMGFKPSTIQDGKLKDGVIRIAFLNPEDGGGTGHVALIIDGETLESHGHVGPDRRPWTGTGWQAKAHVYVLTPK